MKKVLLGVGGLAALGALTYVGVLAWQNAAFVKTVNEQKPVDLVLDQLVFSAEKTGLFTSKVKMEIEGLLANQMTLEGDFEAGLQPRAILHVLPGEKMGAEDRKLFSMLSPTFELRFSPIMVLDAWGLDWHRMQHTFFTWGEGKISGTFNWKKPNEELSAFTLKLNTGAIDVGNSHNSPTETTLVWKKEPAQFQLDFTGGEQVMQQGDVTSSVKSSSVNFSADAQKAHNHFSFKTATKGADLNLGYTAPIFNFTLETEGNTDKSIWLPCLALEAMVGDLNQLAMAKEICPKEATATIADLETKPWALTVNPSAMTWAHGAIAAEGDIDTKRDNVVKLAFTVTLKNDDKITPREDVFHRMLAQQLDVMVEQKAATLDEKGVYHSTVEVKRVANNDYLITANGVDMNDIPFVMTDLGDDTELMEEMFNEEMLNAIENEQEQVEKVEESDKAVAP